MEIAGAKGWRMISSPTATTYLDLLDGFVTQGMTGSTYPSRQPNFLWFDETDTLTTNMSWRTPTAISENIKPGRGFYFYVFGDIANENEYNDALPQNISVSGASNFSSGTFDFSGLNHPVTFSPREGGQSEGEPLYYDTNIADEGWNMVGNPTSFTLDWNAVAGWTRTNIDNSIYVWDPNSNQWKFWNGVTGDHNGLIPPFQAFWVTANNENPVLSFTEQVFSSSPGTFYKQQNDDQPITVPLTLSIEDIEASAFISLGETGVIGPDLWDAYRLEPLSNTWLELFTLSSPSHFIPLVINNLPFPDSLVHNLPVYVGGQIEGTGISGEFTLHWQIPDNWPQDWGISLQDHGLKTATSMTLNDHYSFEYSSVLKSMNLVTDEGFMLPDNIVKPVSGNSMIKSSKQLPLFSIIIKKVKGESIEEYIPLKPSLLANSPNPFTQSTTIRFSLPEAALARIDIFDFRGAHVTTLANTIFPAGFSEIQWRPSNNNPGIYHIRLISSNTIVTQKAIMMK